MDVEFLTLSPEGMVSLPKKMMESMRIPNGGEIVAIASIPGGDGILLKPVRHPSDTAHTRREYEPDPFSEEEANEIVSQAIRDIRREKRA